MRKRLHPIWFLCLHISVLVAIIGRPLIPYIDYALRKDYIARELCEQRSIPKNGCNGKCQLRKQIQAAAENEQAQQKPTKSVVKDLKLGDYCLFALELECPDLGVRILAQSGSEGLIRLTQKPLIHPPESSTSQCVS